jgi:hypothetical protein
MSLEHQRQLQALADDVARMPVGCDCSDCYRLRNELAERAVLILKEIETR